MQEVPANIKEIAAKAKEDLLPQKSKCLYESTYELYKQWCAKMKISRTCEDSILAYFYTDLINFKSSSLWTKYSMLRSTIKLKEGVDISTFPSVIAFLKRKGEGYKSRKSLSLSEKNVEDFLNTADEEHHLLNKVILIFGVAGACRRQELVSLLINNVEDCRTHFFVKLVDAKTKTDRSFIILPGKYEKINLLEITRKYISLRPQKTPHERFFVNYSKTKCTVQPVGVHKISSVPSIVAKYLNLENYSAYTGHCFRRTSASILANAGASMEGIKRHGGWRSSTVAEGYIDESEFVKKYAASQILGQKAPEKELNDLRNTNISANIRNESTGLIIRNNANCVININYYNTDKN